MDFLGKKINGKLVHSDVIAEQKRKYWNSIKEGADVKSSLTVPRKDKSQKQLGAIWGLMMSRVKIALDDMGYDSSFIYNLPSPTGVPIDETALCGFFYVVCPIKNEEGFRITLSKANTKEAAKFFDDVRNYCASQWSIVVPDPNPNWKQETGE